MLVLRRVVRRKERGAMHEDFEIDPIWERENQKKRKKGGPKGKRGERLLVDILNKRFEKLLAAHPDWGNFHRSIGSGNRWSQAKLSDAAHQVFSSDVVCENCLFAIESKFGYDHINFDQACKKGNKQLDGFIEQVTEDGVRTNKIPLLIWKKTGKEQLAFLKGFDASSFSYSTKYKNWTVVLLKELLEKQPDSFFFAL